MRTEQHFRDDEPFNVLLGTNISFPLSHWTFFVKWPKNFYIYYINGHEFQFWALFFKIFYKTKSPTRSLKRLVVGLVCRIRSVLRTHKVASVKFSFVLHLRHFIWYAEGGSFCFATVIWVIFVIAFVASIKRLRHKGHSICATSSTKIPPEIKLIKIKRPLYLLLTFLYVYYIILSNKYLFYVHNYKHICFNCQ